MEKKMIMKKLQRGPTLKLSFTIMRKKSDSAKIVTELINMGGDTTEFTMEFTCIDNNLQIHINIKNKSTTNKEPVLISVVCEEAAPRFITSNKWEKHLIKDKSPDSSIAIQSYNSYNNSYNNPRQQQESILLYNFEVNITLQFENITGLKPVRSMVIEQLYEDIEFSDFQLQARDGVVPVHRTVLTLHSDMFKTMLRGGAWTETKEGRIDVKGVTVKTLKHLKDYMYLGVLPDEGLEVLLLTASLYLMDRLQADCIAKLIQTVKPDDFEDLIEFACQHNMPDLIKAVLFKTPDDTLTAAYELDIATKLSQNM